MIGFVDTGTEGEEDGSKSGGVDSSTSFLIAVHENKIFWKPTLDITINLNLSKLSDDVQSVQLEEVFMNMHEDFDKPNSASNESVNTQQETSQEETQTHNTTTDSKEETESEDLHPFTFFPINAWNAINHVVLKHRADRIIMKLGQAVFAIAFRCKVFSIFGIMINTLFKSVNILDIKLLYVSIENYMKQFLNKFSELNEMLKIDAEVYEEWLFVINSSNNTSEGSNYSLNEAKLITLVNLLKDYINATCERSSLIDQLCDLLITTSENMVECPLIHQFQLCENAFEQLLQQLSAVETSENKLCDNK